MNAAFFVKGLLIILIVSNFIQWGFIIHIYKLIDLNRAGMNKIGDILGPMIDLIERLEYRDLERTLKEKNLKDGTDDGR